MRFRSRLLTIAFPAAALVIAVSAPVGAQQVATANAVFAGGCFWGIEAVFEHTKGVLSAVSGYTGGGLANPKYEDVLEETTGHAEAVRVTYDPAQITYAQLMEVFFAVHDPTEVDRQGPDKGPSYRTAIFFTNEQEKSAAAAYILKLNTSGKYRQKIATTLEPLKIFWPAEDYHQHYLAYHPNEPYIVYNDQPKLVFLKKNFPALWRADPVD